MTAKIVYQNPWFEVVQDGKWHYVHEPDARNGAVIVAQQGERYILVRVLRQAHCTRLPELPRGYGAQGESALVAAARELREETGYDVALDQFERVGEVRPNTAVLSSTLQVFSCTIPTTQQPVDRDDEVAEVMLLSAAELNTLISAGEISCGITLAALLLAQQQS